MDITGIECVLEVVVATVRVLICAPHVVSVAHIVLAQMAQVVLVQVQALAVRVIYVVS